MMIFKQNTFVSFWSLLPYFWFWILLIVWTMTAGPDWFGQVHAKWREVKLYAFLPKKDQQMQIFGTEMVLLSAEVERLSAASPNLPILIPPQPWPYPIGNNPPLLRALTHGKRDFVLWTEHDPQVGGILFWPDDGSSYLPAVSGLNPEVIDWRVLTTKKGML